MKVLSFGHIPSWAGGRQETGLANVIYQLAKHGSEQEGVDVYLAATDVFESEIKKGNLCILGWTKQLLLRYVILHPIESFYNFKTLKKLKQEYPFRERMLGLFLKRVFFEYVLNSIHPDVVHLHSPSAVWFLDLVDKDSKVAVTFHGLCGLDVNIDQHETLFKMEREIFHSPHVDEIFFICTQLVEEFKSAYGENGKGNIVIFNSYDNEQFYYKEDEQSSVLSEREANVKSGEITLYTVASLSDRKGQLRVLSGLTSLPDRKKFKYVCIGADNDGIVAKMKEIAQKDEVNFEYKGKLSPSEIRNELVKADYMIMPSSSEGFGLTYLEAIACGVPVIIPRNLPIVSEKELINDSNSILLDDCTAKSITKVLKNIDNYSFNHNNVAQSISNITWDEIAKQYLKNFKLI